MNRSSPRPCATPSLPTLFALLACAAAPALAAPDVGVSVHINQPGVYGRIDIGNVPPPPPALVYAQPILVQPPPRVTAAPPRPAYLWVPPGHQRKWHKHCARYDACGVPVYFVQDRWYREHVQVARGGPPAYVAGRPGYAPPPAYGPPPVYGRDDEREGRRDDRGERGHGHGHGHGHGKRGD